MALESIIMVSITVLSLASTPYVYIWRMTVARLDKLETEMKTKVDEDAVRQILEDKIEPLDDKCKDIQESVNKILEHLLKSK